MKNRYFSEKVKDELAGDGVPKEYEQRVEEIALSYSDTAYADF